MIGLVGCGPREPATDAEQLARGRELVQKMSARLAAAPAIKVTTTEVRDAVRLSGQEGAVVASRVSTPCGAPMAFTPR